jgi:ATP-dependent DNA ligase
MPPGYRLRIEHDDGRVLITRGGHDWTKRFPWVAKAALSNRRRQFVIDGEAVVLGVDGIADFNALHSGKQNAEVQFCAFDVLAVDGEDVRELPLSMRKLNLDRLLRGRPDGICQSAFKFDPVSASNFDPFERRVSTVALASSELAGVAETWRARAASRLLKRQLSLPVSTMSQW